VKAFSYDDCAVGAPDVAGDAVEITPNPAVDVLSIRGVVADQPVVVQTITGQPVAVFRSTATELSVPVHNLAAGVYIISVQSPSGPQSELFVVAPR
jgi:hypothetical protein